jgi:hypothetical protein
MTKEEARQRAQARDKRRRDEWRAFLQQVEAEQRGREARAREDRWFEERTKL